MPSDADPEMKNTTAKSNDNSDITLERIADKFWTILEGETTFAGTYDITLPTSGIGGMI